MRRLRLVAAAVSLFTIIVAWLFALDPTIGRPVVITLAVAALCLVGIVPFDAMDPPARKRVVAACCVFVLAVGGALASVVSAESGTAPVGSLLVLMVIGLSLVLWSFRIRNRRRRPGWTTYYDL